MTAGTVHDDRVVLARTTAAWLAVAACLTAAVIEGVCAGRHVRSFFENGRFPRYSAPLWLWSCIGAAYYLVFGIVLYRLLGNVPPSGLRTTTLALVGFMMLGNGLSNLTIFRYRNLQLSSQIGNLYAVLDLLLVSLVLRLDGIAAWTLAPYLAYRVYAVWWGHAVAKLNVSP
jgi:tryptophan-rich sensory protein